MPSPKAGASKELRGASSAAVKALIRVIKKLGPSAWKSVVKHAKKGFKSWVDSLSFWNPLKWAFHTVPSDVLEALVKYIMKHF